MGSYYFRYLGKRIKHGSQPPSEEGNVLGAGRGYPALTERASAHEW